MSIDKVLMDLEQELLSRDLDADLEYFNYEEDPEEYDLYHAQEPLWVDEHTCVTFYISGSPKPGANIKVVRDGAEHWFTDEKTMIDFVGHEAWYDVTWC